MALDTRTSTTTIGVTRARQGRTGTHLLWVLIIGTLLAALGLFAALAWKSDDLASANANNGEPSATSPAFASPEPAPVTPQSSPATSSAPN